MRKQNQTSIAKKFCFDSFIKNTSINTSTMILERRIVSNIKFPKLKLLEDYIFKCKILKKVIMLINLIKLQQHTEFKEKQGLLIC